MENKNEMIKTNKKSPVLLIVILAIAAVFTLCTIGIVVSKVASTNQENKKPNEIVVSDGEEITVSDEAMLRELFQKEETLTIVIDEDIYTSKPFVIKGTKTLTGSGSILMKLDAEAKKDLCAVSSGAKLIVDGVTIDGNGVATGINVNVGAELSYLSGKIVYGMPYGIQVAGKVEIEDITIDRAMHTGIYVATGGEVYITGGKITNSIETSIALATKAYAKISGDVLIDETSGSHVYNYGKLDITGGKFSNSSQNAFYNFGEVNIISESDKLVEICNSDKSAIASISGAIINVDGLYIHDMGTYGINTTKGSTGTIKNCVIEKTGKVALNVLDSKVTAEDVKISDGQHRGIVNNNGTATFKNVEVNNMLGAGVITAGKKSVTTLENITVTKVSKSGLGVTGGTVTAKNLTISESAGSGINITKEAGTTEITNSSVAKSGKNGLAITIGKLTAKNLIIDDSTDNGIYMGKNADVNLTDSSITNSGIHAVGNYGGKFTTKKLTIDKTERGGIVSKGGTVNCDTTTISNTGSRAVNLLEDCKCTMNELHIKDAGNTGVYADGGTLKLTDYEIEQVAKQGVYLLNSEKMVLQNGKISNTKTNGVFVGENANVTFENTNISNTGEQGFALYKGTVTVRNLTIKETGKGGFISDGGVINGHTVAINKTTSRAISLKNNATANIKTLAIANSSNVGIWVEDSTGNFTDFTIDSTKSTAVNIAGAGQSYLKDGVINANAKGVFVNTGAETTANNLKVYRMEGNAEPLIDVHIDAAFTLKHEDSLVEGNGYAGRGMRVNGTVTMTNGTIRNNNFVSEKDDGIGGAGVYIGATGSFVMKNGTIEENTTTESGAGVYVRAGGKFTLTNGTIQNNESQKAGAGVAVVGTFVMKDGTVNGNSTTGNAAGILVSKDATFTMNGGTVASNTAGKSGGGIFVQSVNTTITGGTIKKNTANVDGAGVYVHASGILTMEDGAIQNNTAERNGGGLYIATTVEQAENVITGGVIGKNTAAYGGGVFVASNSVFKMNGENATVENNHSTQSGAGVAVYGTFNLESGKIQNNTAEANAAGILVNKVGVISMTGGTVAGNVADGEGGGIYIQSESSDANFTTNIHGGSITNNGAANGAGIYVDTNKNVSIKNVTIESNTATENGGGVYVNRARSCVMSEGSSIASNTAVNGGGVYMTGSGIFTMEDGSITANGATGNGAGVYVGSNKNKPFAMTGGTISGHGTADARCGSVGAGVFVANGSVFNMTGENATVENNHSTKSGAGVAVYGTFNLTSGKIQNNTTTANAAGILVNKVGVISMTSGTVAGNVADGKGGGIYIQSESSDADFTTNIHGGSITNNGAANGAGIYVDTNKNVSIKNVTIESNTATENGGGVYVNRARNCVMSEGSSIASNTAVNGGGVYMTGSGIFTMEAGSITSNIATGMGAGVYVGSNTNKPFTMTGGTISGHGTADTRSSSLGAGVYIAEGSVFEMNGENAVIENNYSSQPGAGVYVASAEQEDGSYVAGTFNMKAGTIRENNTTGNGAGVLLKQNVVFTMSGGTITNNTAGKNGGGIFTQSVNTTITGGLIEGNTATGTVKDETLSDGNGGGVYVHLNGILTMGNGTIKNNTAAGTGGGIYIGTTVDKAVNTITGGVIEENTATNGGGIYVNTSKDVAMSNMTIQKNTATQNGGGVYVEMSKSCNMTSGTITGNSAVDGGGVYTHNKGAFAMAGGTITNNTATGNGGGVCVAANTNKPFNMTGGTISGHGTEEARSNSQGAGVYVANGSVFNMNGDNAVIENNYTSQNGAGVYVVGPADDKVAGTFTLSKGIIRGNDSAMNGGGIFLEAGATMTMTGGQIINNHCTANGGAICAAGSNVLTLQAGEISGNSADKTVQGVFIQSAGNTSQVTLYTTFIMGNEIRYNSLSKRGTDNPVLIVKGNSLDYTLNLGFHNKGTVYIQCDNAEAAAQIYSKISQYGTSWNLSYKDGDSYIKAAK